MLKSIEIKNYRGIKNLKIDNFKKYNFFVGDNGSCKTTILESLFSAFPNSPEGIITAANSRGLQVNLDNKYNFFFNADEENKIEFILNDEIVTKINTKNFIEKNSLDLTNTSVSIEAKLSSLMSPKFLYNSLKSYGEKVFLDVDIMIDNIFNITTNIKDINNNLLNKYSKIYGSSYFISPSIKYKGNASLVIKELIKNKKKNELIDILNLFEKDIDDINLDGSQVLLSKKGVKKLLPISSFGGGLSSILDIVTYLFDDEIKTLFIDEIETGIHYLNYPKFCESLIKVSKEKDIQLFITTHSKEILEEFYKILENTNKDDTCLYRFQKNNDTIKSVHYTKERALSAIQNNWDVR